MPKVAGARSLYARDLRTIPISGLRIGPGKPLYIDPSPREDERVSFLVRADLPRDWDPCVCIMNDLSSAALHCLDV